METHLRIDENARSDDRPVTKQVRALKRRYQSRRNSAFIPDLFPTLRKSRRKRTCLARSLYFALPAGGVQRKQSSLQKSPRRHFENRGLWPGHQEMANAPPAGAARSFTAKIYAVILPPARFIVTPVCRFPYIGVLYLSYS